MTAAYVCIGTLFAIIAGLGYLLHLKDERIWKLTQLIASGEWRDFSGHELDVKQVDELGKVVAAREREMKKQRHENPMPAYPPAPENPARD